ncbi:MAG: hypothetical protein EOM26_03810 [Alphaproteobacteria bacterium]|nr:hypothetical protein [Alphaproteobacteria bacterium]
MIAQKLLTPLCAMAAMIAVPAFAQGPAKEFIGPIAQQCIGNWESQACISILAQSNLVLAANYAEKLEKRGQKKATEAVKEHCAAATAATQQDVPAYAMRSAMTECANAIYDISRATKVEPDQSHYQLLVYPTMCLSEDQQCPAIEAGLEDYR